MAMVEEKTGLMYKKMKPAAAKQEKTIENIRALIHAEGMDKKILRTLNPRIMSFALSGMILGVIFNWVMTTRAERLTQKISLVLGIFLNSVLEPLSSRKSTEETFIHANLQRI